MKKEPARAVADRSTVIVPKLPGALPVAPLEERPYGRDRGVSSLREERILLLGLSEADTELNGALRQSEVSWHACSDVADLCNALQEGAAAVLLTEGWADYPGLNALIAALEQQPIWSGLPVFVLAREASPADLAVVERLGHVTLLERPLRLPIFTAALRSALRTRKRQYEIREQLREREYTVNALRESEERLRFSLEAGRLGFWQHDLAENRLFCSDLCKAHFGRTSDEPISHEEVLATVHPDDREYAQQSILDAIRGQTGYILEYRVLWPDGSLHWLMVRGHATYHPSGKPICTFGVTLDITRRKSAEARQLEQSERLRLLSESAAHLLTTTNPARMVRELFEQVREFLGLSLCISYQADPARRLLHLASSTGVPIEVVEQIGTLDFGEWLCGQVAASRAPLVLTHVQESTDPRTDVIRSLGMRAYVCNPLQVGDQLLGTLCFAVRNRDAFSEEEIDFLRTVSHYVALAQERVRVEDNLREEARRKDEFLAMLAHELRNPLSPLASAIEIMRARPGREQGERARQVVERQLRHLRRLIDDLLDVSRINSGKIRLQKEHLDLVQVVEGALESMRSVVASSGHTLEIQFPHAPVYVSVDPVRLEQVVTNLIHNAVKYTEPGGTITVILDADASHARLRVRDTGIGIPPNLLGHVFDLFTQGERSLDRSQGGLGLGLTLVRNLTQLHGGSVEVFSEGSGRGSEFLVTLPVLSGAPPVSAGMTAPKARPAETAPPSSHSIQPSNRVLVVDDNRDSAETLAELAELWGFEVDTAYDGLEGLQRATEWEPGVVFLDIGMPGLNGYEVARQLRADVRFLHVTLVALTGYGQQEDFERSRAAGFDHHLVKPVDIAQVEKLLRRNSQASATSPIIS